MTQVRTTSKKALGKLAAEMAVPTITASALRAQHAIHEGRHRKLELIDAFHGFACSWCGCRFPETERSLGLPGNLKLAERHRLLAAVREKQFAAHVCAR